MNKTRKALLVGAITVAIGAGGYLSTPQGTDAASNVVLASVDWVTSQLDPVKTKVATLETKVTNQEKEIASLKEQVAKLQNTTPTAPAVKSGKVYTIKDDVKIHSGASPKYKVLATKPKSSTLEYVDTFNATDGLWYRVKVVATVLGWVSSSNVSTSAPTVSSAATTTSAIKTVRVTGDAVNLRSGATTKYPVVQVLTQGTSLVYHTSFVNSLGETWYNVQTASGLKGWISGSQSEVL